MSSLFLMSFVNGATNYITTCPTNWNSGDTYVLQEPFASSTCTLDTDNVTITTNNNYLDNNIEFVINDYDNIVFTSIDIDSLAFNIQGTNVNNLELSSSRIRQLDEHLFFHPINTQSTNLNNLIIDNNYIFDYENNNAIFNANVGTVNPGSGSLNVYNLTITDNAFINFAYSMVRSGTGTSQPQVRIYKMLDTDNNILGWDTFSTGLYYYLYDGADCVGFDTSNLITKGYTADSNHDFINDDLYTWTEGSCYYFNGQYPTRKSVINEPFSKNTYAYSLVEEGSSYFDDNTLNLLIRPITLNTTQFMNLQNVQYVDIGILYDQPLTLEATGLVRMGNNNKLLGNIESGYRGQILTSTDIDVSYDFNNPFATTWQLITLLNNNVIDSISFYLTTGSNYGVMKQSFANAGDYLEVKNCEFDYDITMDNSETPVIYGGDFMNIHDNTFTIDGGTSRVFTSSGTRGGHLFQDNIFTGAGWVFQDLATLTDTYLSKANHNKFENMTTSPYTPSYPFDPLVSGENPLSDEDSFILNGTYQYENVCDVYLFNIGNWYEDWSGTIYCNDSNSDDICDIGVLRSTGSANINDYRVLTNYTYDFSGNTGTIIPYDICGSFLWDIDVPENNTNYNLSTGQSLTIEWSYASTSYSNMDCFTKINDRTDLNLNVGSGDLISYSYELLTGIYNFQVICENEYMTQESPIINFTVNSGTEYESVPAPEEVIYGCTDPEANNYNPNADIDDSSCTYDEEDNEPVSEEDLSQGQNIIGDNIETTDENTVGFIKNLTNGAMNLIVPVGIFFFVLLMIGGTMALIR